MAGPPLRRKFRVVVVAEGDTWDDAGDAAACALVVLQRGDPDQLRADAVPFEAKAVNMANTHGWKVEISRDDRMTHETYVDLKRQAGGAPGVPEAEAGEADEVGEVGGVDEKGAAR